jgi:uncharacterized hydrophobic protein (TIGR00271 family)
VLHLRVTCPAEATDAVLGTLRTNPGTVHLTVLRGAAVDQVDFIYQVGPFSLILALLAGAAGMLSLTSAKSAALIGVFISVTTVPAAAFAVVAVTTGAWRTSVESTLQLFVNLVGIVLAGVLVLVLRTRRDNRNLDRPLTQG